MEVEECRIVYSEIKGYWDFFKESEQDFTERFINLDFEAMKRTVVWLKDNETNAPRRARILQAYNKIKVQVSEERATNLKGCQRCHETGAIGYWWMRYTQDDSEGKWYHVVCRCNCPLGQRYTRLETIDDVLYAKRKGEIIELDYESKSEGVKIPRLTKAKVKEGEKAKKNVLPKPEDKPKPKPKPVPDPGPVMEDDGYDDGIPF